MPRRSTAGPEQLQEATSDAFAGLREQLEALQVLDGTASSWPGVTQSIVDLKDIVGTLHRCERDNRAEAEAMRKESQDLAVKLATAQNRLTGATQDAKEKEEYFQGLQGKLEGDLSQKATAFTDLQDQIKAKRETILGLEERVAEQRDEIQQLNQYKLLMNKDQEGLNKELQDALQELERGGGRQKDLKRDVKLLQEELNDAKVEYERMAAVHRVSTSEGAKLQAEVRELREERSRLKEKLDTKDGEVLRAKEGQKLAQAEVEQLKKWQTWVKQAEAERLREEREKFTKERADLQRRLTEARLEADKLRNALKTEALATSTAEGEKKRLQQDAWIRNAELRQIRAELITKTGERDAEKRDREARDKEIAALKRDLAGATLERERLQGHCQIVEIKCREELARAEKDSNAQIVKAERDLEVQGIQMGVLQRDLKRLSEELLAASAKGAEYEKQKKQLAKEVTEREAAQHRLQGELASTSAALDRTIRRVHREAVNSTQQVSMMHTTFERMAKQQEVLEVQNLAKLRAFVDRLDEGAGAGGGE